MKTEQPTSMDELMNEFVIHVDDLGPQDNGNNDITIDLGNEPKEGDNKEPKEPKEPNPNPEPEPNPGEGDQGDDTPEPKEDNPGVNYKDIALKYLSNGTWSKDIIIEDEEGNEIPISELDYIDEEKFFEIEKAIRLQEEEDKKGKYISIEDVEDRKKHLIEILINGGDLREVFKSEDDLEEYVNPFKGLDLDNEVVQSRIYLNALMKYNQLDEDSATQLVEKAKKDLTLDVKVKDFVNKYNEKFDKYVEAKKIEIINKQKEEAKKQLEFKKALREEYKSLSIKDTLANKLAESAVSKKEGEYEIDTVYAQKMEDPKEAAELILFLTDKKAYLDMKLQSNNLEHHKQIRQKIKLIPKANKVSNDEDKKQVTSEFEFEVPAR